MLASTTDPAQSSTTGPAGPEAAVQVTEGGISNGARMRYLAWFTRNAMDLSLLA